MVVLSDSLNCLSKGRVLCLGDVMLDHYVYGHVERISPEAPVPVLRYEQEHMVLGGAGHVARNLNALQAEFALVAISGDDDRHHLLHHQLTSLHYGTSHILPDSSRPTPLKTRYVCGAMQMLRVDDERTHGLSPDLACALIDLYERLLPHYTTVLCSDYGKGTLSPDVIQAVIHLAHQHGKKVLIDPKGSDYARYAHADVITPNLKELKQVVSVDNDTPENIIHAAQTLRTKHDLKAVVVTCGAQGMVMVDDDHACTLPAHARDVFDVTGAGDTVIAVLAGLIAGDVPLKDALVLANVAAGLVVGKPGTATVTCEEIALETRRLSLAPTSKIMSFDRLNDTVTQWRRQGLCIGFTNGCFDLLHAGHVALLQEARGLCDRLIVALNTDTSIQTLKGSQRPIYDEHARAHILSSLEPVDAVVLFSEDTPITLIQTLRPDILIKGGDYTLSTVVGAEDVQSWGGIITIIPLKPGFSTTTTVQNIQQNKA